MRFHVRSRVDARYTNDDVIAPPQPGGNMCLLLSEQVETGKAKTCLEFYPKTASADVLLGAQFVTNVVHCAR